MISHHTYNKMHVYEILRKRGYFQQKRWLTVFILYRKVAINFSCSFNGSLGTHGGRHSSSLKASFTADINSSTRAGINITSAPTRGYIFQELQVTHTFCR